jgi:pyruvate dehydrogenase E1 component beta subunit
VRELKYWQAISEAQVQCMESDDRVFIMGIGVDDPKGIFGTTLEAYRRFGKKRVFDTPVAENAMTGCAIGAALAGMRPVMVHARNDFMYYCMDQLCNHAAKWHHMFGGLMRVPITVRAIVGRGWGQGSQHSQSLQALFSHVPGLKVVMPSTPYSVKGLLIASIRDDSPVIFIEHRRLYDYTGPVAEEPYTLPLGKGAIIREGREVTVAAVSYMVWEAIRASAILKEEGIEVEVIDLRSTKPLDEELIINSVKKTGRLVVADTAWRSCGVSAEVAALVAEKAFGYLKAPIQRVTLPDVSAPTSIALEKVFYPGPREVISAIKRTVEKDLKGLVPSLEPEHAGRMAYEKEFSALFQEKEFHGPF